MANFFDQFDAPISQPSQASSNFFDQFEQKAPTAQRQAISPLMDTALASNNARMIGEAMNAPKPLSMGGEMAQQHYDTQYAAGQGTSPHVYAPKGGEYARPLLGEVEEWDNGLRIKMQDGRAVAVNPSTDVVLRDPATGKLLAFERTRETDEGLLTSIARLLAPGLANGPVTGVGRATALRATQTGADLASMRAAQSAADLEGFARLDVRPFGPAFQQGPAASIAKQLSEVPIIGSPVKNALDESLANTARAAETIADRVSPTATFDRAGANIQRGLERYRTAGVRDIDPRTLEALDIAPRAPVQPTTIMSREAARRAADAALIRSAAEGGTATTSRGVDVAASRPRDQMLVARRGAEDMSDTELQRLVRTPSNVTSFGVRAEALYETAWRQIPTQMRINDTANPQRVATVNTRTALQQLDTQVANQISGQGLIDGALAARLRNARSHSSLDELRSIRTEIGRSLSNFGVLETRLDRTQLKSLYAAVSRDIEVGLQDLANRAYLQSRVSGNRPDHIAADSARRADGALYAFRRADRYFRQGMERIDQFMQVMNASTPEQAAKRVVAAALDRGRGNANLLRTVRGVLRPEEWNDVVALVIRDLGHPVGSARGTTQELGFSVASLTTRVQNMTPEARQLLFGGPMSQAIDDLIRVSSRLANVEAMANTSRSASNAISLGTLMSGGGAYMAGGIEYFLGSAAAGAAGAALFSRPQYARWATRYAELRAQALRAQTGPSPRLLMHINQLEQMAQKDTALLPAFYAVRQDNSGSASTQGQ